MQPLFETQFDVQAETVVAVDEGVGGILPREFEDVLKFETNAIVLDVASPRHDVHRIDKAVFHEHFAVGQPVDGTWLPGAGAEWKLDSGTSTKTPESGDGIAIDIRGAPPLEARPVVHMDVRRVRDQH